MNSTQISLFLLAAFCVLGAYLYRDAQPVPRYLMAYTLHANNGLIGYGNVYADIPELSEKRLEELKAQLSADWKKKNPERTETPTVLYVAFTKLDPATP